MVNKICCGSISSEQYDKITGIYVDPFPLMTGKLESKKSVKTANNSAFKTAQDSSDSSSVRITVIKSGPKKQAETPSTENIRLARGDLYASQIKGSNTITVSTRVYEVV